MLPLWLTLGFSLKQEKANLTFINKQCFTTENVKLASNSRQTMSFYDNGYLMLARLASRFVATQEDAGATDC